MATIDAYIDAARERSMIASDRLLALALEQSPSVVSFWRSKRTLPSDENMIQLAELAGLDPEAALVDLAIWRAESRRETKAASTWKTLRGELAEMAGRFAKGAILPMIFGAAMIGSAATSATAETEREQIRLSASHLYIMR